MVNQMTCEVLHDFLILLRQRPALLLHYGVGLGDNLLCTCIAREFARRGLPPIWMLSDYPALFDGNSDIGGVLTNNKWLRSYIKRSKMTLTPPFYASEIKNEDREIPPSMHILGEMCRRTGLIGSIDLRPYLSLPDEAKANGLHVENQIVIHSSGMGAKWPIPTKEWFPERFTQVVEVMRGDYNFVQVGDISDPPLEGAVDLRGRTSWLETAAILSQSLLFIGQVGFLMHLARAVECRSVIVYGGREHPGQSGYICNENIYTALECAPCWRRETCPFEHECMRQISVSEVVRAARKALQNVGAPLDIETLTLTENAS